MSFSGLQYLAGPIGSDRRQHSRDGEAGDDDRKRMHRHLALHDTADDQNGSARRQPADERCNGEHTGAGQ